MQGAKDWAINCLKEPETGRQEGEGKRKTMLRVIELSSDPTLPRSGFRAAQRFYLGSVKVEEYGA